MPSYNALHTVLEAAVNLILPCAEINLVMSPNYALVDGRIEGADYRVECKVPMPSTQLPILVSFDTPTERVDGSDLPPSEIKGYEVEMATGCVKARTIDTTGQAGPYTPTICPLE